MWGAAQTGVARKQIFRLPVYLPLRQTPLELTSLEVLKRSH